MILGVLLGAAACASTPSDGGGDGPGSASEAVERFRGSAAAGKADGSNEPIRIVEGDAVWTFGTVALQLFDVMQHAYETGHDVRLELVDSGTDTFIVYTADSTTCVSTTSEELGAYCALTQVRGSDDPELGTLVFEGPAEGSAAADVLAWLPAPATRTGFGFECAPSGDAVRCTHRYRPERTCFQTRSACILADRCEEYWASACTDADLAPTTCEDFRIACVLQDSTSEACERYRTRDCEQR